MCAQYVWSKHEKYPVNVVCLLYSGVGTVYGVRFLIWEVVTPAYSVGIGWCWFYTMNYFRNNKKYTACGASSFPRLFSLRLRRYARTVRARGKSEKPNIDNIEANI